MQDETEGESALVNKLAPCAWLFSGDLEVWRLRLRLLEAEDDDIPK